MRERHESSSPRCRSRSRSSALVETQRTGPRFSQPPSLPSTGESSWGAASYLNMVSHPAGADPTSLGDVRSALPPSPGSPGYLENRFRQVSAQAQTQLYLPLFVSLLSCLIVGDNHLVVRTGLAEEATASAHVQQVRRAAALGASLFVVSLTLSPPRWPPVCLENIRSTSPSHLITPSKTFKTSSRSDRRKTRWPRRRRHLRITSTIGARASLRLLRHWRRHQWGRSMHTRSEGRRACRWTANLRRRLWRPRPPAHRALVLRPCHHRTRPPRLPSVLFDRSRISIHHRPLPKTSRRLILRYHSMKQRHPSSGPRCTSPPSSFSLGSSVRVILSCCDSPRSSEADRLSSTTVARMMRMRTKTSRNSDTRHCRSRTRLGRRTSRRMSSAG